MSVFASASNLVGLAKGSDDFPCQRKRFGRVRRALFKVWGAFVYAGCLATSLPESDIFWHLAIKLQQHELSPSPESHRLALDMSATGTLRGTPKGGRPHSIVSDSPSNIPRPKLESVVSDTPSSYSASRAKTSKRDEVKRPIRFRLLNRRDGSRSLGHSAQD